MVSKSWKELSHELKAEYHDVAIKDRNRYEAEKSQFKGPWTLSADDIVSHKRPPAPFISFLRSNRGEVRQNNPELTGDAVTRIVARMWKDSPLAIRKAYRAQYDQEWEQHKSDMLLWESTKKAPKADQQQSNAPSKLPVSSQTQVDLLARNKSSMSLPALGGLKLAPESSQNHHATLANHSSLPYGSFLPAETPLFDQWDASSLMEYQNEIRSFNFTTRNNSSSNTYSEMSASQQNADIYNFSLGGTSIYNNGVHANESSVIAATFQMPQHLDMPHLQWQATWGNPVRASSYHASVATKYTTTTNDNELPLCQLDDTMTDSSPIDDSFTWV
jgi:hypothetical protein